MNSFVFATANVNKLREVNAFLGKAALVQGLADIGCHEEIAETADSLEGNAELKARYVYERYGLDCFSEDTGLEIDYLGGAPGVHTARFAGPEKSASANMAKVLKLMVGQQNRQAQFRAVFALIKGGELHLFEGITRGTIAHKAVGNKGFGYDPIFIPQGYKRSFGEMEPQEKYPISHRTIALKKMMRFLESLKNS